MVAVLAPAEASLLALVSVLAPVIATGNTAVLVASEQAPLAAISLAEVLATSDVPGGVVNVLTGQHRRTGPGAGRAHGCERDRPDRGGPGHPGRAGAGRRGQRQAGFPCGPGWGGRDWAATPGLDRMLAFLETKTVWHPIGT